MSVSYLDVCRAIDRLENYPERKLSTSVVDSYDEDVQVLLTFAKQQMSRGGSCEVVTGRSGRRQVIVKGKR